MKYMIRFLNTCIKLPQQIKILHIVESIDPKNGGVSQAIKTMIISLSKSDISNEVVTFDPPEIEYLNNNNFPVTGLGKGLRPWSLNVKILPWLSINLHRFNLVIIHGIWLFPSYASTIAISRYKKKTKSNLKYYIMPHGMLDPYFQKDPKRQIKAIRNWVYWKMIENKVIRNADGLLFTTAMEKFLAKQSFSPYLPKTELVVNFGITPPPKLNNEMINSIRNLISFPFIEPYWLFLSRISEKKGLDLLIKSYLKLKLSNPNIPKLLIAGPGIDSEYGKQIMLLCGNSKEIFFAGMLEGNAKWGAFYGCELFALISHQENFGIAIVEALACSKPVLISEEVNIWKEIIAEKAGIAVKTDIEKVIEGMIKWTNFSSEEKLEMGQRSNFAFNKYFNSSTSMANLLESLI
jgi:glycosyltransferase involved in cell wall biosynthesis